ncbi:MAG: BF3164 family lipoprotein [Bacteroidales bacterium]|nr:BF3164 family lipoprotein [Bacteroidales bacterium]
MRNCFLILIIFALFSCKSNNNAHTERYIMPVFKQKLSVTPKYINKDKPLRDIYSMHIHKDYLLLRSFADNNLIQLFNKNNGDYIAGIAPRGRGPGEYTMTVNIFFLGDTLCLFDRRNLEVNFYDSNFISNNIPYNQITLEGASGFFHIVPYKQGFITVPTKDTRFIIHDKTGTPIGKYTHYPSFEAINDSSIVREALFTGSDAIDIKPDHTKLVSATFAGAIIEIFSLNGNTISLNKEIRLLPPTFLKLKNNRYRASNESYVGFWNIQSTQEYIYLIFSGKTINDFKKSPLGDYIYVYDWDGNPIKSYKINGGVNRFAVDEAQQRIYFVTFGQDGNEIIGYFSL